MPDLNERQRSELADEQAAAATGVSTAAQLAAEREEQVTKNERFLAELADPDIGDDFEADLGPLTSSAFVTAHQDERSYRQFIRWINENEAERDIVRNNPGRHLKERPMAMAVAQDLHVRADKEVDEWIPAMTSQEREDHRRALRALTAHQSLGAGGKGIETVGTVQTSTEVNRNVEEQSSTREKLESLYR